MKLQINEAKFWQRFSLVAASATLALTLTPALFAQSATPTQDNNGPTPEHRQELQNFDQLLDQHPEFAQQVRNDPSLLDNKQYLESHPELKSWMNEHPGVAQQVRSNPTAFVNHEVQYNKRRNEGDLKQVNAYDELLKNHPDTAAALRANPSLASDPAFLAKNPGLANWMSQHPQIASDLKNHPEEFQKRANQYAQHRNDVHQHREHHQPSKTARP